MAGIVNKVKDILHKDKDTTHSKHYYLRLNPIVHSFRHIHQETY
jgi:hypothetical protein